MNTIEIIFVIQTVISVIQTIVACFSPAITAIVNVMTIAMIKRVRMMMEDPEEVIRESVKEV